VAPALHRPFTADADILLTITGHQDDWRVRLSRTHDQASLAEAAAPSIDFNSFERRFMSQLRDGSLSNKDSEDMGREIAGFLFPPAIEPPIRELAAKGSVRLRISAEHPDLLSLPWEFARLSEGFACQLPWIHLVREIPTSGETMPRTRAATTVLIVHANPGSGRYPSLASSEAEAKGIARALDSRECRGILVETIFGATPKALEQRLALGDVDVLHFVGHGDVLASGGVLIFEGGKQGEHAAVYAEELTKWLVEGGVRVAVLSGCLTGSPMRGVGRSLVAGGLDSVVAMQFPIADVSAFMFSRAFYSSLKDGFSYEEAVYHGRMMIRSAGLDWGIPVLLSGGHSRRLRGPELTPAISEPKHNVPNDDRPFIGRSKELKALRKAVVHPTKRLVTITGMGGMGKTRLARQFARTATDAFQDGVCFVECEALDNEEELRAAIGAALRLEDKPITWDGIAATLQGRRMLLVLDCFERLLPCVRKIDLLLKGTDQLKVLVTSRILLGLSWEQEFVLDPMSLPKRSFGAEGVELFVEAASHADPNFRQTPENRKLLSKLVQDLEAVPLAIVLAAGRLRHLSLEDLHTKVLTQRLDTLKRRPIGEDRHENLVRVVEDSFNLLNDSDRSLAFRLSVFRGGFYVEDAVAVLKDDSDVQEAIYALRDNSLLTSQVVDSRMRFRSLDTVREYIHRVAPNALQSVARNHAEYFAKRADEIRRAADETRLAEANAELWREAGNFRSAITFAVDAEDSRLVRNFASSLARAYFESGARTDFDYLAIAADRHATLDGDRALRIELFGLQGALYRREGDPVRARDVWLQRARLAEEIDEIDTFADSMLDVADIALERKDYDSVDAIVSRVEGLGDRVRSLPLRASGMLLRARVRIEQKELTTAIGLAEQAEELVANFHGDRQAMYVWFSLAEVYRRCGSLEASERLCRHMIAEGLEGGYTHYMGRALLQLSATLEQAGQIEPAVLATVAALAIPRTTSEAVRQEATRWARQLSDRRHVSVPKPTPAEKWEEMARTFVAV